MIKIEPTPENILELAIEGLVEKVGESYYIKARSIIVSGDGILFAEVSPGRAVRSGRHRFTMEKDDVFILNFDDSMLLPIRIK